MKNNNQLQSYLRIAIGTELTSLFRNLGKQNGILCPKYNRNDIRRYLTKGQRKMLSQFISVSVGYKLITWHQYKVICQWIGIAVRIQVEKQGANQ